MGETEKSAGGSVNCIGGCELFQCDVCSKLGPLSSLAASARDLIWLTTRLQYAISLDLFGGPEYRVKMGARRLLMCSF